MQTQASRKGEDKLDGVQLSGPGNESLHKEELYEGNSDVTGRRKTKRLDTAGKIFLRSFTNYFSTVLLNQAMVASKY